MVGGTLLEFRFTGFPHTSLRGGREAAVHLRRLKDKDHRLRCGSLLACPWGLASLSSGELAERRQKHGD